MLAFVAVACGRFNLRRELIGGGYALLHAAGMAGVKGQALSLLGLVGLEATGEHLLLGLAAESDLLRRWVGSQKLRDIVVRTVIESNVGIRAQVVGLAIAVLFSATGVLGTLGSMLGARSMSLLFSELRSFAMFHGLKWGASNLQVLWATLCTSSDALKVAFLEHVLGKRNGKPGTKVDDQKRAQWARDTLEKVAARIPQLPVEAIAPELAAILKAWDQEKIAEGSHEAIDEWVEIDRNDEDLWAWISYNKHEEMEISSANIASYVDKPILEDFTHRPSHVEDTQYLEQVACKTFQKSVVRGQGECATLDNMAWKARPAAPWRMEVEEPDSDDEFGSVNVDGNDEDDIEVIDLGDL